MTRATTQVNRREFLGAAAACGAAVAAAGALPGCRTVETPPASPPTTAVAAAATAHPLDRFGVTEADARAVMARAMQSGGEYCDLYFQHSRLNHLGLEDQAVNSGYSRLEVGLGVRVVRGLETGYAYTESLDRRSMLQAAEVAAAVAAGAPRPAPRAFCAGRARGFYPVEVPWPGVSTGKKVELLMQLHELAARPDPRVKKVNISYRDEESSIVILTSEGQVLADYQPMVVAYLSCLAEDQGRRESNYYALAARAGLEYLTAARLRHAAQEAVRRTTILFEATPGPVGELPVVLGPGGSGILLHEAIGHGMEADFARKKTTIYADKIGARIAPAHVTIVDDGTNPNMRGSINIDDEGNPGQRTVLVERGILRTFLHDRISARHFGVAPTGSGRRESFRHMPIPRMRNTYMLAGPHDREEIIRSVKRGIYAEHFTNGQVLIGAGDFTFYVKNGRLIEDGKLTRPIKDVNIIGNGPRVLEQVEMVGADHELDEGGWTCGKRGQGVPVGLGLPTVKVAAITVGGTRK